MSEVLGLPTLPGDDRLQVVLQAALQAAGGPAVARDPQQAPWDAAFFGLDRTTAFRGASAAQQRQILGAAGRALLEEAYYVEQCGMVYAATMSLGARSVEERALYSLFGADEARHLRAVSAWLPEPGPPSVFHRLLESVLQRTDPVGAVLVVQVLLEGWGLRHYRDLADGCNDPDLAAVLHGIVSDETRHHGSGVILLQQREIGDEAAVVDVLCDFFDMVRAGPQGVLAAIEQGVGPLSRADRVTTLRELGCEQHSAARIELLRGLLGLRRAAAVREALEARGRFVPLTAEQAAG